MLDKIPTQIGDLLRRRPLQQEQLAVRLLDFGAIDDLRIAFAKVAQ